MDWTELLKAEVDDAYRAAEGLLNLIEPGDLDWKPSTGDNWWTTGQLLNHVADACGFSCQGFVTGNWEMPESIDPAYVQEGEMMPPAEAQRPVRDVAEAREKLAADKALALRLIDQVADRMDEPTPAPWDPRPVPLGQRLLQMVGHLHHHKAQLYYYLKLQGKPVNTMHFYGMA